MRPVYRQVTLEGYRGETVPLIAAVTIFVAPLCQGLVPHRIIVSAPEGLHMWVSRLPGVFMARSILVDCGLVDDGEISTAFFNMSNQRVRIGKGECISKLVLI